MSVWGDLTVMGRLGEDTFAEPHAALPEQIEGGPDEAEDILMINRPGQSNLSVVQSASEIEVNSQHNAIRERQANEAHCRNGNYAYCSGIQGFQIQITLTAGMPTQIVNNSGANISPLLFYGISFVFDKHGGFQAYGLTRDISFDPHFQAGSAEKSYPMNYGGAGITLAAGTIYGSEFAAKGTEAYGGTSVDRSLGIGPVNIDHYDLFNESTGSIDGTKVSGDDIGISVGTPVSGGSFAIFSNALMPRIGLPIQSPFID